MSARRSGRGRVESGCGVVGEEGLVVCLIGMLRGQMVLEDRWGRVVFGIVGAAGRIGVVAGVADCCTRRCIVVVDNVAEAVVGIEAAGNVFVAGRRVVDGCQAVLGLCPCSIRLLPFVFQVFGCVWIDWRRYFVTQICR
jgi:hypothetical protein